MVAFFKRLFTSGGEQFKDEVDKAAPDTKLRIAVCAVLLEMANSDDEFAKEERLRIIEILREKFALTDEEAAELIEISQNIIDKSIDIWAFTKTINNSYSIDEKIKVIEAVWSVIYVDGQLSGHEDTLVHKLSFLMGLTHGQLIDAKLKVLGRK